MNVAQAITWDDAKSKRITRLILVVVLAALCTQAAGTVVQAFSSVVSVIVRAQPGQEGTASQLVTDAGGQVVRHIDLINGVVANVPANAVAGIARNSAIVEVTPNVRGHLDSSSYDPTSDVNSMYNIEEMVGAHAYWDAGYTGQSVDVALIDSGVTPVDGLSAPGKIINGPDLSFESQNPSLLNLDTFGHGTNMAGIIAGRDSAVSTASSSDTAHFMGMAPGARIVSIKVADALGQTDVSQMLAAIDWVVQHRTDNGLNIRVLNLSFGTDSTQSYQLDPLAYAAEQAWKQGIAVVVSAGNGGRGSNTLDDPAIDPYVIAVGAVDTGGTTSTASHFPASFTSQGDGTRNPDLAAPGVHVVSLRDPGSFIDTQFGGTATVASRFFRGSGTSQAAAEVSGAAALIISQRPSITPDQLKALLTHNTGEMHGSSRARGKGELNLASALHARTPTSVQTFTSSTGLGSLESARGSRHVTDQNGNQLTGEQDIFGNAVDTTALALAEQNGSAWNGGTFNGSSWTGSSWSGSSWSGSSWSGSSWSGSSWSGSSWSSGNWDGSSWSGSSWSGSSWSSGSWEGSSWSAAVWS